MGAGLDHRWKKIVKNANNFHQVKHIYRPEHEYIDESIWKKLDENSKNMVLYKSDIALIELKDPWTFDEKTRIKPACLVGFERERFEDTFLAAGYGLKGK